MRLRRSLPIYTVLSLLLLLLTPLTVFAINSTATPNITSKALKDQIREQKEATSGADDGVELQKRIQLQEKFKAKKEAFKEKLQTIKDEKKKAVVENLDTKISNLNKKRTEQMTKILDKLTDVLERIRTQAQTLKAQGKNTTPLDTTITKADTALATAKTLLTDQLAKEYAITITTESKLRSTVGQTVSQLQTDLQALNKTVIAARQAVENTYKELKKLQPKTTPTLTITPTIIITITPTEE